MVVVALLSAWAAAVLGGFVLLERHANAAGVPATPPNRAAAMPSRLLVFLHPKCPCAASTVSELERLMPAVQGRAEVRVCIFAPSEKGLDWPKGALCRRVREIPGLKVVMDQDGALAKEFGVRTSGQVMLYDRRGALAFSGGITAARGHEGRAVGQSAILDSIEGREPRVKGAPVFGCAFGF